MLQQRTWCALSGHGATACTAHSAVSVAEQAPDRVSHAHAVASCTTAAWLKSTGSQFCLHRARELPRDSLEHHALPATCYESHCISVWKPGRRSLRTCIAVHATTTAVQELWREHQVQEFGTALSRSRNWVAQNGGQTCCGKQWHACEPDRRVAGSAPHATQ